MAIFKRIKNILSADVHSFLDSAENSNNMLKLYTRELEDQIVKAQEVLADQLFAERKTEAVIADIQNVIAKRARQADLAVDRNEEHMAELALSDRIVNEKKLLVYRDQLLTLQNQIIVLTEQVGKLKEARTELQYKQMILASRASAAAMIQETNEAIGTFQTDRILNEVARLEDKVWRSEAKAHASERAHTIVQGADKAYVDNELQNEVQIELQRLKEAKNATSSV
jgi:phage shock protein A